jgi:hypothetical protein
LGEKYEKEKKRGEYERKKGGDKGKIEIKRVKKQR